MIALGSAMCYNNIAGNDPFVAADGKREATEMVASSFLCMGEGKREKTFLSLYISFF